MTTTPAKVRIATAVADRHTAQAGGGDGRLFAAPGRVDLIGAHVDYNGGDVLPVAIDRVVIAAASPRTDGLLRMASLDLPGTGSVEGSVEVPVEIPVETLDAEPPSGWAAYPAGVVRAFARATGVRAGLDLVVGGDLPMGVGLSSSAALEVVTATALDALHGTALGGEAIARLAHEAETEYVGVPCGIMDQFASALCRAGHALLLHCRDASHEHVPLGASAFEILVMDTREPRALLTTGYAERVSECAAVASALREGLTSEAPLALRSLDDLERVGDLPEVLRRRARHVITEHRRVANMVAALGCGDLAAAGAAMDASHASATHDHEVGTAALDAITEAARAQDGVFGARLCGAGFGGSAIALVHAGAAEAAAAGVRAAHRARTGVDPGIAILRPAGGPRAL